MSERKDEQTSATLHNFRARSHADALERINRITGLKFNAVPESLVPEVEGKTLTQDDAEELVHRALSLWEDTDDEAKNKGA